MDEDVVPEEADELLQDFDQDLDLEKQKQSKQTEQTLQMVEAAVVLDASYDLRSQDEEGTCLVLKMDVSVQSQLKQL